MPVQWEFTDKIIVLRMIGAYTPDDIKKALHQAVANAEVSDALGLIFDVSQSKSLSSRSRNDMVAMAYFLAGHAKAFATRVTLVAFDDFSFGMMRMAQAMLEHKGLTAEVFREEADARKWLLQTPRN